jgi:hypothetical protein
MRIIRSRFVTLGIALVWVLFAILGKLAPITPTHQGIVARVFGDALSSPITVTIGIGEVIMALWILSGRWPVVCGSLQILLVITMNCIELTLARDLLLWGALNGVFALLFVGVVYCNMVAPRYDSSPCNDTGRRDV